MFGPRDPQLTQRIIDEETQTSISTVLRQLIRDSQATSGRVLDRAGQIIVWDGPAYEGQRMQFGALLAGTCASTRVVTRILQEAGFQTLLQGATGRRSSPRPSATSGWSPSSSGATPRSGW